MGVCQAGLPLVTVGNGRERDRPLAVRCRWDYP